jgi:hypothetical protein
MVLLQSRRESRVQMEELPNLELCDHVSLVLVLAKWMILFTIGQMVHLLVCPLVQWRSMVPDRGCKYKQRSWTRTAKLAFKGR